MVPKRKKFHHGHERVASSTSDYGSMMARDRSHSEERMRLLESRVSVCACGVVLVTCYGCSSRG